MDQVINDDAVAALHCTVLELHESLLPPAHLHTSANINYYHIWTVFLK